MISYGPVPSRRLGRSLGINNIPSKHCSYSCVYCQLGKAHKTFIERKRFYSPEDIFADVQDIIKNVRKNGTSIDYITFVSSGEPTLDLNLGNAIDLLKLLGYKVAVISNSSLIWIDDVRNELKKADWISLKIDTINEQIWKKMNQPNNMLHFSSIKNGLNEYSKNQNFVTETMILNEFNSDEKHAHELAQYIAELNPETAYLSIPVRPPAYDDVLKPDEEAILKIFEIFKKYIPNVEILMNFEDNNFLPLDNIESEILNIISVHPLKEEFLESILNKGNADWKIIDKMIENKILKMITYQGNNFYIRTINSN